MNCKDALRREMVEKRKNLNLQNGGDFERLIKSLDCYKKAKTVMLYMPIKGEADVTGILSDEKIFLTPVTEGDDIFSCRVGESFIKGSFSVPEPCDKEVFDKEKIDIVFVPGVAFDKCGNRMGYGKGYYDRFLKDTDVLKIGVCHSFQIIENVPVEEHDIKMDMIITEREVWSRENI